MKRLPFDLNVVVLLILLVGIILTALWILESPTDLERWAAFFVTCAGFFQFFKPVVDEFLERRYNKGGFNKKSDPSIRNSMQNDLQYDTDVVYGNSNQIPHQRPNFFKYFVIIVVSGAVGAGCLALATVDYPETLFFVLILPALIGSIGLTLLVDIYGEMQDDPFWRRLTSAVLWGALGAFVGIIVIAIVLLYFIFKEGSGPTNIDFRK